MGLMLKLKNKHLVDRPKIGSNTTSATQKNKWSVSFFQDGE